MFTVTKKFKFEAAHRLHKLPQPHPCSNLHGHSYKMEVTIGSDDLDPVSGFVIDFGELKTFQKWLDDNVDHSVILGMDDPLIACLKSADIHTKMYIMNTVQSSAEHMAHEFAELIYTQFNNKINIKTLAVKVWETAKNCAVYNMPIK